MKIFALALVLFFIPVIASADQVTVQWDFDTANELNIDGFNLYSGHMGQDPDGAWNPQYGELPKVGGILPSLREITFKEEGWEGVNKKFCFMLRSTKGDKESADSNMVCTFVNNTPLMRPAEVDGVFDPNTNFVSLSWIQDDLDRTTYWKVFYKPADDGEAVYKSLGTVENIGNNTSSLSVEFLDGAEGEITDFIFVVVAFKNTSVYSPDSAELGISVDRTDVVTEDPVDPDPELPVPQNLRIIVTIPLS